MKQLKIALICKNENSKKRDNRNMGYWSYAVPEFTWEHFTPGKNFTVDIDDLKDAGYDLVFHEDYPYGVYVGDSLPIVFLSIDSTLSEDHFKARYNQSKWADLVLVDHDNLNRYSKLKQPVYQFPYCVNDKMFYRTDEPKTKDIVYHCSASNHAGIDERKRIRRLLHDLSVKHNWSYKSGVMGLELYAESMRHAKIVVNQSRTPINRPHRIFDAMASGACVITSKIPYIYIDRIDAKENGLNYGTFHDDTDLEDTLEIALSKNLVDGSDFYESIAERGYNTVMKYHTWSVRAKQLREIINKEFGI